ncbi:MAG: 3-deoxy-7-phosphoheptulonate synthase [Bacilli bacterium]
MIKIKNLEIKRGSFILIAGPCSVESRKQIFDIAKNIGNEIDVFRGGAFKPRTSPTSFQGLEKEGIDLLVEVKKQFEIPIISELMNIEDLKYFNDVDIIQIGARNMQNYPLLRAVGKINKPILLKRGIGNTIDELIKASEYISSEGNEQIILCERGIRTFENSTRFTLDLSAIPVIKTLCDYPVFVDPSHAAGRKDLVIPLSKAAKAVGADGLIIEVHNDPANALSDNLQQLDYSLFKELISELEKVIR